MESIYQKLFSYFSQEHNVLLLESEMQDVVNICAEIIQQQEHHKSKSNQMTNSTDRYLFRGKRVDDGEWLQGDLIHIWIYDECNTCLLDSPNIDTNPLDYKVDPSTVGQWTGLVDENDTKIFEGDVVKCSYFKKVLGANLGASEVDAELVGVIKFNNLSLTVSEIHCKQREDYTGYSSGEGECKFTHLHDVYESSQEAEMSIEILGNVHDNPDLLG